MKRSKSLQPKLLHDGFADSDSRYGGKYLNTRKGRSRGRPLSTQNTMHLVIRSSKATGLWSFLHRNNKDKVKAILRKFSEKYGIKILTSANVGNHIHLQIKLSNRMAYKKFIRASTSAIAMAVTGWSRWTKTTDGEKFWDQRPFSQIVVSYNYFLKLQDYIQVNKMEGFGIIRDQANILFEKGYRAVEFG